MLEILAQAAHPISPDVMSPTSWNEIFKTLGFSGGLVILGVAMMFALVFASGLMFYRISQWVFGPDGWCKKLADKAWDRVEACLTTIEERTQKASAVTDAILKQCNHTHAIGGECNVQDFRQAAVPFLNGMVSLSEGKKTDAAERFRDAKTQFVQIPQYEKLTEPSANGNGQPI